MPFIKSIGYVLLIVALAGCGKHAYYKIKKGDTLYSIGWQYATDYRLIAQWNEIPPPYIISTGQWIRVMPPTSLTPPLDKAATIAALPDKKIVESTVIKSKQGAAVIVSKPVSGRLSEKNDHINAAKRWQWPIHGPLLYAFPDSGTSKKGLGIQGVKGTSVRAAAAGKVVYSGKGLIGYGNLVIIKHSNVYLSAYGHNERNLVKEGQYVKQGQTIAYLGSSGTTRPLLHFEIRRNGSAVNPLRYLPKN